MGSDVDMGSDLFDAVVGPVWPGADDVVARLGAGEPERLRDMAVAAVDSVAADVAAAWRDGVTARVKSSAHDVVTQTDIDTEARLIALLRERTPGAVFLGEEGASKEGVGTEGSSAGAVCWVIDPIDGTSNFVHGLPDFGISVAAVVDGVPVAGVVCAPALGLMWRAWVGADCAAVSEQRAASPSMDSSSADSRWVPCSSAGRGAESGCALVTDHPHAEALEASADAAAEFAELVQAFATVRRHVCTTVDVCRLASGVHDAVLGPAVKPWDIAAAALIAVGSGATWLYGGRRAGIPGPSSAPVARLSGRSDAGPGNGAGSGNDSVLDAPMFVVHAQGASVPTARKVLNQMIARTLPTRSSEQ